MIPPRDPENETERLAALCSLDVLDTAEEERFDRITRLARRLFDVPIALVSLVDAHRQWFKSRQGLDATETSREISFCGHAILRDETLVVENALEDERFADNPLVTGGPEIRFYAGCPVRAPGGHRVGTLCLIDREPRTLADQDLEALRDLADMVEAELASLAMATTDSLTGLSNRCGFELLASHALRTAVRNELPVALAYLDLDGFKEINDEHGHAAGDAALVEMAHLLIQVFRDSDVIARLGGDEFVVLMTGIEECDVERPLERLAKGVATRNASPKAAFELRYSLGIESRSTPPPSSIRELVECADEDMYRNKRSRQGRPASR